MILLIILLSFCGADAFVVYCCLVAAGREDERMERLRRQREIQRRKE